MKKKAVALSVLFGAAVMAGCGDNANQENKENQTAPKTTKPIKSVYSPDTYDEEAYWKAETEYVTRVRDSLMTAQGLPTTNPVSREETSGLNDSIGKLEHRNTPSGAMTYEVLDAGKQIAKRYAKKIHDILGMYQICLEPPHDIDEVTKILSDEEFIFYGVSYDSGEIQYHSGDEHAIEKEYANNIIDMIYFSNYEGKRVQEIKTRITKLILDDMCAEMYTTRKSIESKYAKYFAGGMETINEYKLSSSTSYYRGDGVDFGGKYGKYRVTYRNISVNDTVTPVDFYADATAEYTLEYIPGGKWRVAKKARDGKMSYTLFYDSAAVIDTFTYLQGYQQNESMIYIPRNKGGHIDARQTVNVETSRATWHKSAALEQRARALQAKVDRMIARSDAWIARRDANERLAYEMWARSRTQD